MDGNFPSGEDLNFSSGGYPCAVGLDTLNLDAGGEEYGFRLVKMKTKATQPSKIRSDWEYVYHLNINGRESEDVKTLMKEFLDKANPKLFAATGGEVPPIPDNFLDKAKHLCRYGIAFDPVVGIYIK